MDDVELFFQGANKQLEEARFQLTHERYNMAVNRSYYAIFYAAKALLAKKGIFPKKHSGTLHQFSFEYVKKDNFDYETYLLYAKLMEDRSDADYEVLVNFNEEEAMEAVESPEIFINECVRFI